jgi:hypothetical protein
MNAPKAVTDLIPNAYDWSRPKFGFIEHGVVFYQTRAHSNAGGNSHSIYFPVSISGRTLSDEEKWETLVDDALRAINDGVVRRNGYSIIDH